MATKTAGVAGRNDGKYQARYMMKRYLVTQTAVEHTLQVRQFAVELPQDVEVNDLDERQLARLADKAGVPWEFQSDWGRVLDDYYLEDCESDHTDARVVHYERPKGMLALDYAIAHPREFDGELSSKGNGEFEAEVSHFGCTITIWRYDRDGDSTYGWEGSGKQNGEVLDSLEECLEDCRKALGDGLRPTCPGCDVGIGHISPQ
jgi:hypothetical protein